MAVLVGRRWTRRPSGVAGGSGDTCRQNDASWRAIRPSRRLVVANQTQVHKAIWSAHDPAYHTKSPQSRRAVADISGSSEFCIGVHHAPIIMTICRRRHVALHVT